MRNMWYRVFCGAPCVIKHVEIIRNTPREIVFRYPEKCGNRRQLKNHKGYNRTCYFRSLSAAKERALQHIDHRINCAEIELIKCSAERRVIEDMS